MLNQEDVEVVLSLTNELTELCASNARFTDVTRREVTAAAGDLVRYRFRTLEGANRSTRGARQFFLGDIRRVEKKGFLDIAFLLELLDRLPAKTHQERPGGEVRFTEIDIHRARNALSPSMKDIVGSLMPDQLMCNWIQRDRAEGKAKIPSYRPYLVPKLSFPPHGFRTRPIAGRALRAGPQIAANRSVEH